MSLFLKWVFGFELAVLAAFPSGPAWSLPDPAAEDADWAKLVYQAENQPAQPETLLAANQFVQRYPQSRYAFEARFMAGELFFAKGDFRQAAACYQSIPESATLNFADSLCLRQGESAFQQGLWEQAGMFWSRLILRFPDSPLRSDALALQARLWLETGHAADAAKLFQELALDPVALPTTAYSLGAALWGLQAHQEKFMLAVLRPVRSPAAAYAKTRLLLALGQDLPSQTLLQESWSEADASSKILLTGLWVRAWAACGAWAQALAAIERLLRESDLESGLRLDLLALRAQCLFSLQRFEEAVRDFQAWLDGAHEPQDPCTPWVHQAMAQAYYRLDQDAKAMAAYKKYLNTQWLGTVSTPAVKTMPLPARFEKAWQAEEKKLLTARDPRAAVPWLAMISRPPILSVQTPQTVPGMESWHWVIRNAQGDLWYETRGRGPVPETLTWNGSGRNGRLLGAGDRLTYEITLTPSQGKALTLASQARAIPALAYPTHDALMLSLLAAAIFETDKTDRMSASGASLLKQAADLCMPYARQGLRLEVTAADPALGKRQAETVRAQLLEKLEWPAASIRLDVLPSRTPEPERLTLKTLQKTAPGKERPHAN